MWSMIGMVIYLLELNKLPRLISMLLNNDSLLHQHMKFAVLFKHN